MALGSSLGRDCRGPGWKAPRAVGHYLTVVEFVVPFHLRGIPGHITVHVTANDDPTHVGCDLLADDISPDAALGYPICRAAVEYGRDGYAATFGWTQLVRSSDSNQRPDEFELDPISIYRDVLTPYAWFGVKPVFFDAPFRPERNDLRWCARTFLCYSPDAVMTKQARPLAGFTWGFDIHARRIHMHRPTALPAATWDEHVALLEQTYPAWLFHISSADQ